MVIKSISFNQNEILNWIIDLYCPEGFELDPTYSTGAFYIDGFYKLIPRPKYMYDMYPQTKDTVQAVCEKGLPHEDNSISSINFDPPFTVGIPNSSKDVKEDNLIPNRFGSFKTMNDLFSMYYDSLKEFYRILKPNGILVFKCQDTVSSGKQFLIHAEVINQALKVGFYPIDLFVLCAYNRIISGKHENQIHSRKFHSYFIVFRKEKCPVKYSGVI